MSRTSQRFLSRTLCALLASTVAAPSVLSAQQSRAEEQAQKQADKARVLRPYKAKKSERLVRTIEMLGYFGEPVGLYPFIGSVFPGGGVAFGPAVRLPFLDTGLFGGHVAWSIRGFKTATARARFPDLGDHWLRFEASAQWIDAPQVAFFGVGSGSSPLHQTDFLYRPTTLGLTAQVHPLQPLSFGGGFDYLAITTARGRGGAESSIERRFGPDTAPGLGADPTYSVGRLFASVDTRESPGYTTSGGLYRVDAALYRQEGDGPYSFRRLDARVDQFIPVLRANWVVALEGRVSVTTAADGDQVPYFLMPALGGGSVLRAFPNFRFRDRNSLLLVGEYRWTPSRFLDMALFYEAGKVAARAADLDLTGLRRSFGIGARFHAPSATALRIEVARGDEGTRLIVGAGPVF